MIGIDNTAFGLSVNSFIYYAWNYKTDMIEVDDYAGKRTEYLPEFFLAFPSHLRGHLKGKWESCYERSGSNGALISFYAELDGHNRALLLSWINENYHEEYGISKDVLAK